MEQYRRIRKHPQAVRDRMTRKRPKRPAPKTGWVISELSQISAVPVRRLRHYVAVGLFKAPERRGTATRYQRDALLRLIAVVRLLAQGRFTLQKIKRQLDAQSAEQLEAWVLSGPLTPALTNALGVNIAVENADAATTALPWDTEEVAPTNVPGSHLRAAPANPPGVENWFHIELLPGLTLKLSGRATPAARNAAKRIYDEYVGT